MIRILRIKITMQNNHVRNKSEEFLRVLITRGQEVLMLWSFWNLISLIERQVTKPKSLCSMHEYSCLVLMRKNSAENFSECVKLGLGRFNFMAITKSVIYEASFAKRILHNYNKYEEGNNYSLCFEDVLIRQSNYFLFSK